MDSDTSGYVRLDCASAPEYVRRHVAGFGPDDDLECRELSDGNINYVYRVRRVSDGASVVVKQADVLLRSSGRPLDQDRIRIEAGALAIEHGYAPHQVPDVFHVDPDMALIVMEDIGDYRNLRLSLMSGEVPAGLAQHVASFLCAVLLPTTDLVLGPGEKRRRLARFTNPEMCDITENLVLAEPYWDAKAQNQMCAANVGFVRSHLYDNTALHGAIAELRATYVNNTQALLHGDLHTGSIFANDTGIKVIDCEFACYGPIGYDIGNVLGNLIIARTHHLVADSGSTKTARALADVIQEFCDRLLRTFPAAYDRLVEFPLYREPGFRAAYLTAILADSLGYAGTELIRRAIGDARCVEVLSLPEGHKRARMERAMVLQGEALVRRRREISSSGELIEVLEAAMGKAE